MRRAITPAIPPRLYRHFALVTVATTAMLAFFADGENRQAISNRVEAKQQETAVRRASFAKFGAPRLGGTATPSAGSFGSDGDSGGFGRPMDSPRGGQSSSILPGEDLAEGAGYSPEYLASLSPEEREMLIRGLQQSGVLTDEGRLDSQTRLAAASARRSGAHGMGN